MGELLLMAVVTYFGIMFCVACVSNAYRAGGVLGLLALVACIIAGCVIASSNGKNDK